MSTFHKVMQGVSSACGSCPTLLRSIWVRRRTDCWPCCRSLSNPSTFPWSTRPDGSGWRNNRMAAQHLPWDLVLLSSGLKELTQTMWYVDEHKFLTRQAKYLSTFLKIDL